MLGTRNDRKELALSPRQLPVMRSAQVVRGAAATNLWFLESSGPGSFFTAASCDGAAMISKE